MTDETKILDQLIGQVADDALRPSPGRGMTLGLRADRRILPAKIERQATPLAELARR